MTAESRVNELIHLLDEAVNKPVCCDVCHSVKEALEHVVRSGEDFIDPKFMVPAADKYARRLIYKDPNGKYTVMAMVWGKGQGTALHDHSGMWCVECVYRGRIKVDSYDLVSEVGDIMRFKKETEIFAGPGEAGALIPPFEYHSICNSVDEPSVTLHVYGGEMTSCHVFVPVEDGYRRETRELTYTP